MIQNKEKEVKKIKVILTGGVEFEFYGIYLSDFERPNWHYYEDSMGKMYHFRKEHMKAVIEQ